MAGKILAKDGRVGAWVRPVSNTDSHGLDIERIAYSDGIDPGLLDIIAITLLRHDPLPRQCENHLWDDGFYLEKRGSIGWLEIDRWLDQPNDLWLVPGGSQFGRYQSARADANYNGGDSLYLIRVESFELQVMLDPHKPARKKIKGSFQYRNLWYQFPVTDPFIEAEYGSQEVGNYALDDVVLCVSLGDPFEGQLYKLIAGVFFSERFG